METIQIGIIGLGTVGTGVVKILQQNQKTIQHRLGVTLEVGKIADLDLVTDRGISLDRSLLTTDANEVINDPGIPIIAELIGGEEPAATYIHKSIDQGKHVVTANKALLSVRSSEIFRAAYDRNVEIGFEGSVCGGIPVIQAIKDGLAANHITMILGILNGTANFILTRMTDEGGNFEDVLAEAQKLGYAEADPTLDIDGDDTAHKLSILLSLVYGQQVRPDDVYVEGITRITPLDIEFARQLGYRIKLLAISKHDDDGIEARVHPTLIPAGSLIAHVKGVYNAVFVTGDAVGSTMFYGQGAGMMPTGSAVVSDIMRIAGNILCAKRTQSSQLFVHDSGAVGIKRKNRIRTKYYLRFSAMDRPGVLSKISGILAKYDISISSVIQRGRQVGGSVPIFMLIHEALEEDVDRALQEIDSLPETLDQTMVLRIEDAFDTLIS
jgi:homoserine dehydrogenase